MEFQWFWWMDAVKTVLISGLAGRRITIAAQRNDNVTAYGLAALISIYWLAHFFV